MNLRDHKLNLHIEKVATNREAEYYIKTNGDKYGPAIASVFENKHAGVSPGDAKINAVLFASIPQLGGVAEAASNLVNNSSFNNYGYYVVPESYFLALSCAIAYLADKLKES